LGKFFFYLFLTALIITGCLFLGIEHGYFNRPSFFLKTLLLLVFSTSIIYTYLYKADKPGFFLQLYMLTMVVKLLAYCSYVLIIVRSDKTAAFSNVIFFMITYFVFTALEIGFLYKKVSRDNTR
jgi:hypothetical protein